MTKTMRLMALGLSVVVFTGCSAVDDLIDEYADDHEEEYQDEYQEHQDEYQDGLLNIPVAVTKNIVGTWATGCVDDGDEWELETLIINENGTGSYVGKEYSAAGCNAGDEVVSGSENGMFEYAIGEATEGANGEDAVELNVFFPGDDAEYTMVRFTSVTQLMIADDGDEDSNSDTPETRANIFAGEEAWAFNKQ